MAQAATMGPPLSPRETRRSGRRSAPSASTSNSQSPPPEPPHANKDKPRRPSLPSNSRGRRPKQEDLEDSFNGNKSGSSNGANGRQSAASNGRSRRKGKEKDNKSIASDLVPGSSNTKSKPSVSSEEPPLDPVEEEEQGITRCICGSTEDDPDAGEFMVQCESCNVWQHGLCMGFDSEDQLHDDDYYCEKCRPDLHEDLFKKLAKKTRNSSANSHHNSITTVSRVSRSHSPSYSIKPSKRRNTMNSRDAAFDESLKEIMEATAAEAAAAQDARSVVSNANGSTDCKDDVVVNTRKKRKRREDDAPPKKRNRSASSTPDNAGGPTPARGTTPVTAGSSKPAPATAPTTKPQPRNKRGARKHALQESAEGDESVQLSRRSGPSSRSKTVPSSKRGPPLSATNAPGNASHEHGTRRNYSNGVNGASAAHTSTSAELSRAYRNSHAYAVSQQPLFTSWNLPDYLAHLEHMLPTGIPRPLEIRGPGIPSIGTEAGEKTVERGVKVKWPSKRMSVGDMNKRVRSLVEWVGREQASAMDRARRREALEKSFKETARVGLDGISGADGGETNDGMVHPSAESDKGGSTVDPLRHSKPLPYDPVPSGLLDVPLTDGLSDSELRSSNMREMEALMEELISFQERFGPGAKLRERERRLAA